MRNLIQLIAILLLVTLPATGQNIQTTSSGSGGSVTYPLAAPNGNSSTPSYSFSSAPSSGVYAPSTGSITLLGQQTGSAAGGAVSLTGGTATSGNNAGGSVGLTSGNASGSGIAGDVNITSGNGSSTAAARAGNINITAGSGNGTAGSVDGTITLKTQNSGGGGTITIQSGLASSGTTSMLLQASPNGTSAHDIVLAVGGVNATSYAGNIRLEPTVNQSNFAGSVIINQGGGTGSFHPGGIANAALTSAGNGADTTEDTLQSYNLPASSLDLTGRCVRISSWGTLAANGDTKTIRVYFGASVISSGGLTLSGVNWTAHMMICKTGANSQSVIADMIIGTTVITPYYNAGTDTDSSAIIIKTTGQAGAANANDVVNKGQIVEFLS